MSRTVPARTAVASRPQRDRQPRQKKKRASPGSLPAIRGRRAEVSVVTLDGVSARLQCDAPQHTCATNPDTELRGGGGQVPAPKQGQGHHHQTGQSNGAAVAASLTSRLGPVYVLLPKDTISDRWGGTRAVASRGLGAVAMMARRRLVVAWRTHSGWSTGCLIPCLEYGGLPRGLVPLALLGCVVSRVVDPLVEQLHAVFVPARPGRVCVSYPSTPCPGVRPVTRVTSLFPHACFALANGAAA